MALGSRASADVEQEVQGGACTVRKAHCPLFIRKQTLSISTASALPGDGDHNLLTYIQPLLLTVLRELLFRSNNLRRDGAEKGNLKVEVVHWARPELLAAWRHQVVIEVTSRGLSFCNIGVGS